MMTTTKSLKVAALVLAASALLALAALVATLAAPHVAEGQSAPARHIDLWAASGSATMPGVTTVPIWGFTDHDPTASGGAASLSGPVLRAQEGDQVTVTLHNTLGRNVSFTAAGTDLVPDTQGVSPGASKDYTFTANRPGTYLYESGVNPQAETQMGLYGALIVEPGTPGQAYDTPSSAYDAEAVMVLSEVDPAFHQNPDTFDMRNYAPKYFLINGKSYPQTDPIQAAPGQRILFRYVNAGYQDHTLQILGMDQHVIASDGNPLGHDFSTFSQMAAPGETYDLIGQVPASAASGQSFPLYSAEMSLSNGGMMTFVQAQ